MYNYRATILKWLDGDTVDVSIDLGFFVTLQQRVRIYGINCPEIHSTNSAEKTAGQAALGFAETIAPPTTLVTLASFKDTGKDTMEKFGRFLAELTLPGGKDFGDAMLRTGHAVKYFGGPRPPFSEAPK